MQSLSATVVWEDCEQPSVEVFFRVYGDAELINTSDYNAFLVACAIPALHYGERRIQVDGGVCPWLVDNLTTMLAYFNHWFWYEQGRRPGDNVQIEAKDYIALEIPRPARVGMFFSGGVDSLYTLRKNHLTFPKEHPGRIQDIIFLHGFDSYGNRPKQGTEEDTFWYFVKECEPVARDAQVNMIPVWTNLRRVGMEDTGFFVRECCGAALGAVAHALSGRFTDMIIASSDYIADVYPYGTTPTTDPRLSSFNLRIQHDAENTRRIEKVQGIADWQIGLDHLRVCFAGGPGTLNCGECEKCLRTKLALLCFNRLHTTKVFKNNNLNVGLVLKEFTATDDSITHSAELIHGLRETGNQNLARAVAAQRALYYIKKIFNLRELVTWLDKRLLGGRLKTWYHSYQ